MRNIRDPFPPPKIIGTTTALTRQHPFSFRVRFAFETSNAICATLSVGIERFECWLITDDLPFHTHCKHISRTLNFDKLSAFDQFKIKRKIIDNSRPFIRHFHSHSTRNSASEMPGKYLWTLWWSTSTAILGIHILQMRWGIVDENDSHTAAMWTNAFAYLFVLSVVGVVVDGGCCCSGKTVYLFIFLSASSSQLYFIPFVFCILFFPVYYFFRAK